MIEDPPLLTVRRNFARPSADQIAALTGAQTGHVVDAMNGRGALAPAVKPIEPGNASFCGVAVPCRPGPDDNLAIFAAVDVAKPGDVILAATDDFTTAACVGDMLAGMMVNGGVVAFVTDGAVRDRAGIVETGLPCFAQAITPNSCARNGPGTAGLSVTVGGVPVAAGDIIVGDADGVVVVPQGQIDDVISRLAAIRAAEQALEAKVKGGLVVPEFVRAVLDSDRTVDVE